MLLDYGLRGLPQPYFATGKGARLADKFSGCSKKILLANGSNLY